MRYTLRQKLEVLPKVLPFLLIIAGTLYVLYGGIATPSEAAGVGALLCLVLVVVIYRLPRPGDLWRFLRDSMREAVMILMIVAAADLFSYMMSTLFITQTLAAADRGDRGQPLGADALDQPLPAGRRHVPAAGRDHPDDRADAAPIIDTPGFDPIWFGVILTINMEIGLITPPVGLNLYVINGIAPDVRLPTILWGALPFVLCMVLGIVLLCLFPQIALWLPRALMGPGF